MFIGILFLLVVGGILGWLASVLLKAETWRVVWLNIAAGIAGAFLAAEVINPLLGAGDILAGHYGTGALLVAFAGTVAVLAIFNAVRRGAPR